MHSTNSQALDATVAPEASQPNIVETLTARLRSAGVPFLANDNISGYITPTEMKLLRQELARRAEYFLQGLVIDTANDHNTSGTAGRIAKMYLEEVFKGRYTAPPVITDFPNAKGLDEMYMTGPITIRSACSHHFVPIVGRCWIGIIPGDRVIGLSKFNRIVDWVASRPQIQEELVMQIADYLDEKMAPRGLAVVVEATHMCMTWRGVREGMEAKMTTNVMRGAFRDKPEARAELMAMVAKG
jgi:GTP cyclohydrolase I